MNILVFIQNNAILDLILGLQYLQKYRVKNVSSKTLSLKHLLKTAFDLMIFETNHLADYYNFCRSVKIHCSKTKILAISTVKLEENDVLLQIIDGHLQWPFNENDLTEKIKSLQGTYGVDKGEFMVLGDLVIYPEALEVTRGGNQIPLRKKEYQLLEFLARNKNKVVNRHSILEYIWDYSTQTMTNTLDVHISNLRKKIDDGYAKKMLRTIYGAGYKLCDH